jgi:hypothetical protein
MAEKWVFFNQVYNGGHFYDEESIKDNKDGTYSLAVKYIINKSEEEIRKLDSDDGRGVGVGSAMMKVIISCSPFKALTMEWSIYKHKDLTGLIKSIPPDRTNWADEMIDTEIYKKTCGNNNAALTPATTTPKVTIDDAKSQCTDIGFKTGTERFGECVLELMQ